MRRFEFNEGTSNKFWEAEQIGADLGIRFGKIGTTGQSQRKNYPDTAKAAAALDKLIREKTNNGYVETTANAAGVPVPSSQTGAQAPLPIRASSTVPPWLAEGVPIDMPPAMAALALPSRRFPGKPLCLNANVSWKQFLAHARSPLLLNLDKTQPQHLPATTEAVRRLKTDVQNGSQASDAVLLALGVLIDAQVTPGGGVPFVDFLVASKGLLYALDVLLDAERLDLEFWRGADDNFTWSVCSATDASYPLASLRYWPCAATWPSPAQPSGTRPSR